jgi:hypothetical protein
MACRHHLTIAFAAFLSACAGRPAQQISLIQPYDNQTNCQAVQAEAQANNQRIADLGSEQGGKVAQNVIVGVAGLFIPVLWFGMDFQGAASADIAALQARNQYLASLAVRRC